MGRLVVNEKTGEQAYLHDDGMIQPVEAPGVMAQAGRQMADLGSGIKYLYGDLTDQPELVNQARAETLERNRWFAGADEAHPYQSMVGQALPGVATFPVTGGASLFGQMATNAAIGATESALDLGEPGTMTERAIAGAGSGLFGDVLGRVAGRTWNAAKGLVSDLRLGRGVAESPVAREAEQAGLSLTESQRATPGTQQQRLLQRLEQGAESSMFSPGLQAGNEAANQAVYRSGVARAIGLGDDPIEELGPQALLEANTRLSEGFSEVAAEVAESGPMNIGTELGDRILSTKGQIKELHKRKRFQGLESGIISGTEWGIARRALASDAANAAARGEHELADDLYADVEILDRLMESRLGTDARENFARLREQYRVLQIVGKQGVLKDGDVSVRNLNRALQAGTGFGKTAQQGLDTVNPESSELINLARLGADKQFAPFRSSGTAENLSAQRMAGMALDPTSWASLAGEAIMPTAVGLTSSRGGRAVTGALTPAPVQARAAGSAAGRSMLDELLYPFVGIEDDRPQ
jgi:hypothetical protein